MQGFGYTGHSRAGKPLREGEIIQTLAGRLLRAGGPQGGGGVTAAKGLGHQVGAGTREGAT